jgi:sugar O-acyltransferase (sialic acid O-acetyltransferase NeuD family)
MSKMIAIIGGGGFAKEVIEVAESLGYEIYGIFSKDTSNIQYPYRGYLEELDKQKSNFSGVIVAMGAFNKKTLKARNNVLSFLKSNDIGQISIISPFARIGARVVIGKGVYIAHNAVIAVDANIGDAVLINTGAFIGHDAIVSSNSCIGPRVFIGGDSIIEKNVTIAVSSNILQNVCIGSESTIGPASLVLKSLKPNSFTLPSPSQVINSG